MTLTSMITSRLFTGVGALALAGSLAGGTAIAAQPDSSQNPVRELRHELRDQTKAQRAEISQLKAEFAAEYAKDSPDRAKLERLQETIEAKRAEISDARFAALVQMHDELDAEQRQRMAERMAKGPKDKQAKHKGKQVKHAKHKGKDKGKDKDKDKAKDKAKPKDKAKAKPKRGETERAKAKPKRAPV